MSKIVLFSLMIQASLIKKIKIFEISAAFAHALLASLAPPCLTLYPYCHSIVVQPLVGFRRRLVVVGGKVLHIQLCSQCGLLCQ